MSGHDDADESKRRYHAPYTSHRPIPTIAKYREEKEARQAEAGREGLDDNSEAADLGPSRTERAKEGWRQYRYGSKESEDGQGEQKQEHEQQDTDAGAPHKGIDIDGDGDVDQDDVDEAEAIVDTSEVAPAPDPKKRRKGVGKKEDRATREVTDPITHLPVRIHDFTEESLKAIDENPPPFGRSDRTSTGLSNKQKSDKELRQETEDNQNGYESFNALFPPPSFDAIRQDLIAINKQAITFGLAGTSILLLAAVGLGQVARPEIARLAGHKDEGGWLVGMGLWAPILLGSAGSIWYLIKGVREWMSNRINDTWEDQVWEANLQSREREAKAHENESVLWLNSLLGAVWPLVNPDLFTSLADTLEDVMQASLPKLVRMVSVDDIGQGSESIRILGIRWLPTGAAARSVGADGNLESRKESKKNDRTVPGDGEIDGSADDGKSGKQEKDDENQPEDGTDKTDVAEGMEAEEGDFINLEIAFAYRARASKSLADRTKDLHLYLAFYLPGNIRIPVWVDFKGIVGVCRLRLQLTPDPPFFALCTMTFLGQPKVDIGCIPLVKYGLNIMDLPLISNFVQSSVDAAMAEYVSPTR